MFNFKIRLSEAILNHKIRRTPKVSEEFSGCRRVWARPATAGQGAFQHRISQNHMLFWPLLAICIETSTPAIAPGPAEHVFRFRHTCSAESLGHAMAKLPIAGRELIVQDDRAVALNLRARRLILYGKLPASNRQFCHCVARRLCMQSTCAENGTRALWEQRLPSSSK